MARAPPPAPSAGQPAAEALKGDQDTQAALQGTGDVADRDEAFGVSLCCSMAIDGLADLVLGDYLAMPKTKTLAQLRQEAIDQRKNALE